MQPCQQLIKGACKLAKSASALTHNSCKRSSKSYLFGVIYKLQYAGRKIVTSLEQF